MERYSPGTKIFFGFFGGLVLGMLAMWTWYFSREAPVATDAERPSATATLSSDDNGEMSLQEEQRALVIRDQAGGFAVAVTHVAVTDPVWVAIYEDAGGQPANALGAGRFTQGRTSGTVHLLRGTLPGNIYYGVLHRDDGDGLFSLERDFPLRDEMGDPIMVTFMTQ